MKKSFVFNITLISIFFVIVLLNLFTPKREYSYLENRYLSEKPELSFEKIVNHSFMDDVDKYINDQFVFRDFWVKLKVNTESLLGKKENNGVYFCKDDYLIEKPMELAEELLNQNITSITNIAEIGRFNVSVCIVPSAYEVLADRLPRGAYKRTDAKIREIMDEMLKDTSVKNINPTELLKENKDKYIYYRTDHHQTSEGSYLLYTALGDALGYTPTDIDAFTKHDVTNEFYGTTYSKALISVKGDTITEYKNERQENVKVFFPKENKESETIFFGDHLGKKDKYSYFLDGNHGITVAKYNGGGDRKIALFKDSYAHSLTPFLMENFDEVHLIDTRYYQEDPMKYLAENSIKNILFLYGASTFTTDTTIKSIGEYAKTSPYANFGLVKECEPVEDSYFNDAAFLGDSLTVGFQAYSGLVNAKFFCKTSMSVGGVFNEEEGGSLVGKLNEAKPKKIYIMLGVNEYLEPSNMENVLNKYRNVLDNLKANNPDALIYIQSMFPMSKNKDERGNVKNINVYAFNDSLCKLAEEKNVYYIDVYKAVADEEGYLPSDITSDGVHLGTEGCEKWLNYLKTHAISNGDDAVDVFASVQTFAQGEYDLKSVAEEIKNATTFEGEVGEANPAIIVKTHEINADGVINAYGWIGGGASAEEIVVFEMKSEEECKKAKEDLDKYVESRIKSFENYIPEEVPKLEKAFVFAKDKFAALVIAKEKGMAEEILEGFVR